MKYFLLYILLLFSLSGLAQKQAVTDLDYLEELSDSERKNAAHKIAYKANPLTAHYDIGYHRFLWEVDPAKAEIKGEVTTYYTALDDMKEIVFDLADNMKVSEVKQRGQDLSFSQNENDELIISLLSTQKKSTLDSLTVFYEGNPVSSGFGSFEISTHGSEILQCFGPYQNPTVPKDGGPVNRT